MLRHIPLALLLVATGVTVAAQQAPPSTPSPVAPTAPQASVARPIPPDQVIADALAAMGGRDRVLAVKTLVIEGYGKNPNIGQAMTPEAEPLFWMLPDYERRIDLVNQRMEVSFTRRPAFPAVFDNARQVQRLDGDVAYNPPAVPTAAPTAPVRLSADTARDRRVEMLLHPLTLLRAALEPGARVTNARRVPMGRAVDVVTARGDTLTLTVDASNRPVSIATAVYHPNLGDTVRKVTFDSYENLDGLRLPKRFVTTLDRWVEYEIGVMKNTLDADLALDAPAATRAMAPQAATPPLNVNAVAPGVWFVTGGGVANMIIEFADHVAIVEAPSEARLQAVMDAARTLVPGKPLTQLILSHHHFDHSAGVRAGVAAGLTVITHRVNVPWFREAVRRTHRLSPDALTKTPKPLTIVSVDDRTVLKDAAMEVHLYHLVNSTHGDGILALYFPALGLYAEPDVWNPGAQINPHVRSLADDIARRQLRIERIVPLHGAQVQPYAEFEKILAEWGGRRATTTTYVPPGAAR